MVTENNKSDYYRTSYKSPNPKRKLKRKIVYIHGTNSGNYRFDSYPQTVYEIRYSVFGGDSEFASKELIIPKTPEIGKSSYSFSWKTNFKDGTNNWINNNVFDRRKASKKLVKEILEWNDMEEFDEIVLYGHSHGGNVAIQAAEELSKVFKYVYIITVATPAMTNSEIRSNNFRLGTDLKISSFKFLPSPFDCFDFYYNNPENPENFKEENKSKIKHIAYLSNNDYVDDAAKVADNLIGNKGMNSISSHYPHSSITTNINIDTIQPSPFNNNIKPTESNSTDTITNIDNQESNSITRELNKTDKETKGFQPPSSYYTPKHYSLQEITNPSYNNVINSSLRDNNNNAESKNHIEETLDAHSFDLIKRGYINKKIIDYNYEDITE